MEPRKTIQGTDGNYSITEKGVIWNNRTQYPLKPIGSSTWPAVNVGVLGRVAIPKVLVDHFGLNSLWSYLADITGDSPTPAVKIIMELISDILDKNPEEGTLIGKWTIHVCHGVPPRLMLADRVPKVDKPSKLYSDERDNTELQWKVIKNMGGAYRISNKGHVFSVKRGINLKPNMTGKPKVQLFKTYYFISDLVKDHFGEAASKDFENTTIVRNGNHPKESIKTKVSGSLYIIEKNIAPPDLKMLNLSNQMSFGDSVLVESKEKAISLCEFITKREGFTSTYLSEGSKFRVWAIDKSSY